MAERVRVTGRTWRWIPLVVAAIGPLAVLAAVVEFAFFRPAFLRMAIAPNEAGQLVLNGVFMGAFVLAGYWMAGPAIDPARYRRIGSWFFGGLLGALGLTLLLIGIVPAATLQANVAWTRYTAVFGAFGGLVIGIIEARSIDRAHAAERTIAQKEFAETQREWFDYLNGLLRHEILNKATVIEGHAVLAAERIEDDDAIKSLETIRRQAEHMTRVISDVRMLTDTPTATDPVPVDLAAVLGEVIEDLQSAHGTVEVETNIPGPVIVEADDLLHRVFANVLQNAVVHNDSSSPEIAVDVRTTGDHAVVDIADNGPGIPPEKLTALFERSHDTGSTHGLGLYLVSTLVDRYDGAIDVTDTGPEGTTFTIELPLHTDSPSEQFDRVDPNTD